MSIFITQLIYIQSGSEEVFHQFENAVLPILQKYNGKLLLRLRPASSEIISAQIEPPYEIHLVEFAAEADLEAFLRDEERNKYLHLKEQSIRTSLLIKGEKM